MYLSQIADRISFIVGAVGVMNFQFHLEYI